MYIEDGQLLDEMLEAAVCTGPLRDAAKAAGDLHDLCAAAGDALEHADRDAAARTIAGLDEHTLSDIIRLVTVRFHLWNKAEQLAISSVNRQREREATPEQPRPESLEEAFRDLGAMGISSTDAVPLIDSLRIEPTLTAHPTEARRRTILDKQLEIARCVRALRSEDLLPRERSETEDKLKRIIGMLLVTDDVRARRLKVPEEVRNGLYYLRTSIWETVPRLMRDLQHASGDAVRMTDLHPIVRYRSWIGGDRDGNPNVTHAVTRQTLATLRETAVGLWTHELELLSRRLSVSVRHTEQPTELMARIEADDEALPEGWLDQSDSTLLRYEPFRYRIRQMLHRIAHDPAYNAASLVDDLTLFQRSLSEMGLEGTVERGPLADAIVRARVFGLHLSALDIRQHSRVHEAAVAELLSVGGVAENYADLDEEARLKVLEKELATPRPLRPLGVSLSEMTTETLATLDVVREAVAREPNAIRSYVISMTDSVSDMLEVLLLMKETGLYRPALKTAEGQTSAHSPVRIVPLYETIDDLQRGPELTGRFLDHPAYRSHLEAVARHAKTLGDSGELFQEIMLGYSDSNKDGGFFMANAALHRAQDEIGTVVRERGIGLCFFHGRGGTVGRGGGRAGRAILATPPAARTGQIRFTEQGEVISFRYALPSIARRHLEQILNATMRVRALAVTDASPSDGVLAAVPVYQKMADRSMKAYRDLIDGEKFWGWFTDAAPIATIAGLPIASRPVSRVHKQGEGGGMTFDSLRAIPWVFSWIQMRMLCPGWFGLGTAIDALDDADRATLREAFNEGTFLETVFDNAMQEMARARLPIARRYAMSAHDGEAVWPLIEAEYERTKAALLDISGRTSLMSHSEAIEQAIAHRNPWTDVLNLIQIDLLRRAREADESSGDDQREALTPLLQASVNGIAAGMQSTG